MELHRAEDRSRDAVPNDRSGAHQSEPIRRTVLRTLDIGGLHLTYAEVDGMPGPLYLVVGPDLSLPAGAEKVDLDFPGDAWFVDDPATGDPQVYVLPQGSSMLFGLHGPGWTRQQLVYLLEHPLAAQGGQD